MKLFYLDSTVLTWLEFTMFDTPLYQSVHLIKIFFALKLYIQMNLALKISMVLMQCAHYILCKDGSIFLSASLEGQILSCVSRFYTNLPFWLISGWRSSMSSCFFCNSSWTSVSFSLSSEESMELGVKQT